MKDVGTLKEIGAQVGDVVERLGERYELLHVGQEKILRGGELGIPATLSSYGSGIFTDQKFRIASRAKPQGPVRTVTHKEIVPGVYGHVNVDNGRKGVGISISKDHSAYSFLYMSIADLTAAIATLTEIREAMEEQG